MSTEITNVKSATHFLISCEHGGNQIPRQYQQLFVGFEPLLRSHRGYDCGALRMAKELALALDAPKFISTTSRLLVDLNRSERHPHLFSEITRLVSNSVRRKILTRYYLPYRNQVEMAINAAIRRGDKVVHISSHSFTPILDGQERNADIGLLYDPSRPSERELCCRWQAGIKTKAPDLTVRRNYPYAGKADGFATYLRHQFSADKYVGIELEINQKHVLSGVQQWRRLRHLVVETLRDLMAKGYASES